MARIITKEALEAYLHCKYKGLLKIVGEEGPKGEYETLRGELTDAIRRRCMNRFLARHGQSVLNQGGPLTLARLKERTSLILDATLEENGLSVTLDGLERRDGTSKLGDFYYVPILYFEGARIRRTQRDLLGLYGLLLGEIQGRHPGSGIIFHGMEATATSVNLARDVSRIRRILKEIQEMRQSEIAPKLTLNDHCPLCEFRARCCAKAAADDDLSLLRGMTEMLKGFTGVLVTDFFTGYDALHCPQQKCLIHLLRDLNEDVFRNPFDKELIALAQAFAALLRSVITTVDRHGLQAKHLQRHRGEVEVFLAGTCAAEFRSDLARGYQSRFEKYRGKLFTFLDHDGVPWNNNNAEHAIHCFARHRMLADGRFTEASIQDYLTLLSLYQSCEYQGASFIRYLRSESVGGRDAFGMGMRKPARKASGLSRLSAVVEQLPVPKAELAAAVH